MTDHDIMEAMQNQIQQLIDRNEALQASMETIQQQQNDRDESQHGDLDDPDPQPLSAEIWNAPVPENFKPPSLTSFDGKIDLVEHITAFNTQMALIGAADSLKCKLLAGTLKDAALRWYMNLPRFSIVGYQDMTRQLIHQFSASRHRKVSSTSLFNVRQGLNESLREYLARYNDATIKVINPNQELFVGAFQNGLRAGQFNESLAQKPADSMEEIMSRAECYIKGEESNAEKKARDKKERGVANSDSRRNYYPSASREKGTFKRHDTDRHRHKRPFDVFTPLNAAESKFGKMFITRG